MDDIEWPTAADLDEMFAGFDYADDQPEYDPDPYAAWAPEPQQYEWLD